MLGGKHKQRSGYTIVEVMIVLAVSGVMFLIAATFISGKQERTSFTAGVNEMASQIQDVIEQITDGQYSDIPLTCSSNGASTPPSFSSGGSQGTNQGCVFLGKFLYFPTGGGYNLYSLADDQSATAVPNPAVTPIAPTPNLTVNQAIPQSLDVKKVTVVDTVSPPSSHSSLGFGGFGFTQSLSSTDNSSNAETINLVYSAAITSTFAQSEITGNDIVKATSVTLCLSDGTQNANVDVGATGSGGNQLSVNVTMLGSSSC